MADRQSELNMENATTTTTSGATPEQIRDNIRRTRANMDETVDAISERLRPRHLLDDVIDLFRSPSGGGGNGGACAESSPNMREAASVAKDLGANAFQKLKAHPMPAALIAAGVAWLLFDENSSSGGGRRARSREDVRGRWRDEELREYSGSFVDARTGQPYDESYGSEYTQGGRERYDGSEQIGPGMISRAASAAKAVGQGIASAASTVGSAASTVAGAASSAASSVAGAASSARHMAGGMTDRTSDYASSAREYAARARSTTSQYGQRASEWSGQTYGSARQGMRRGAEYSQQTFQQSLEQYPLAVVAVALAGGMLAGLLLPATRRENELMGEPSDRLKETVKTQVRDTTQTVLEKGKEVANAAVEVANSTVGAVTEEASNQGLAPDSLTEKVKNVARDVVGAAKESARREGLTEVAQKGKDIVERGKEVAKNEARQQKDRITKQ
ncbi:MAG: DUF3618 domain-containing protein [Planctomycetota bacterium]|nr:DUF3618 domain-containing protein [Planctomycetota bacterium]